MINVIKRNGSVEPFDFQKIKNAVNKAFKAVEPGAYFRNYRLYGPEGGGASH